MTGALWHHPYWLALPTMVMLAGILTLLGFVVFTGSWVMAAVLHDKFARDGPGLLVAFVALLIGSFLLGMFAETF